MTLLSSDSEQSKFPMNISLTTILSKNNEKYKITCNFNDFIIDSVTDLFELVSIHGQQLCNLFIVRIVVLLL